MKFYRLTSIIAYVIAVVCTCTAFRERDEDEDKVSRVLLPALHHNHPRIFGIFSKPPDPDAPKQTGPGIIGNVLHGGTIGIQLEARPLGALQGILGHAKKIIHGGHGVVGKPLHEKPPPYEPHKPAKPDHWEEDDKNEWEVKEPLKPEPEPEGPHWEDIGEEKYEPSTEVPIEDIIMPRQKPRARPKRFIESKIYHVPLAFRSNGKPYKVVERTENSLGARNKL